MGCDSHLSQILYEEKNDSFFCRVLEGGIMKEEECIFRHCLIGGSNLTFTVISTFSLTSLRLLSALCHFNYGTISPSLDVLQNIGDHQC
jgi:hypothetical protein